MFKADDSFYEADASIKPSSIVIQFLEGFLGSSFFDSSEMAEMQQVLTFSMNGIAIMGKTKEKIKKIMYEMLNVGKFGRLNGLIEIFGILSTSNELQPLSFDTISGINAFDSKKMNKVLEYILYEKFYVKEKTLSFCGFKKFHPHHTESTIRLAFANKSEKNMVKQYLREACVDAQDLFQRVYKKF